jgi:hypothetical protein
MGWGHDGADWSIERINASADYQVKWFMDTPFMQRWLAVNASAAAAASNAQIAAAIGQLRNASLLVGAADAAIIVGVPVAAWVGVFVALGAPYLEARAIVRNENFMSGFSQGFVTGILKWRWQNTVALFFKFSPGPPNPFDESLGVIAAKAYNQGLHSGFVQGAGYDDETKKKILKSLKAMSPGTSAGNWDRLRQIAYVIELASAGRKNNFFKTG